MFKKSPKTKQLDMFSSPSGLLCERERRIYDDEGAWHMKFFKEVTSRIDEEVFRPLYTAEREDNHVGRPNVPVRILVAMTILKEGCGCSDEQLYEHCRFNLLFRRALGLVSLDEQCPSIDSYYGLRRKICKYDEEHGENLFEKCFKQITSSQVKEYRISGKNIRMDSKLISSNAAWPSRYELIHSTFTRCVSEKTALRIEDQLVRQQAMDFLAENAAKTVYCSDSATMGSRLLTLGVVTDYLLTHGLVESDTLLARVFEEQYEKDSEGNVSVRDRKKISSKSLQNPNDPDAEYRNKDGKKTKGYVTNITETLKEKDTPSLITDVTVKGAATHDKELVRKGIEGTEEVTGNKVENAISDGGYQSPENREYTAGRDINFITGGIQGKPSRFDLKLTGENTLEVTDKTTGEVHTAIPISQGKWKIRLTNPDGKTTWRRFTQEQVNNSEIRRKLESIPEEERRKRNNVEATIFQYCYHTRNNKTRYRTLIKHTLQALARCAWINMRRLYLFDTKQNLQMV